MRANQTSRNAIIATLALLGLTSAAVVARGFENGDFDEGLAGWKVESAHHVIGLGQANAELGIEEFRQAGSLARLHVSAVAGTLDPIDGPGGAAVALARLQQEVADIPSTALTFDWVAGFWGELSGRGIVTYQARLIVERATPSLRQEYDLLPRTTWRGQGPCGGLMVIDGRPFEDTFYADLGAAGFAAGDDIRVTVEFRAQARALRSCDVAGYGGRVWVDQFALRPPLIKRGGRTLSASRP